MGKDCCESYALFLDRFTRGATPLHRGRSEAQHAPPRYHAPMAEIEDERVVTAARRAMVDRAREEWVTRLIDLSRRNNLLFFRDLKSGTYDLTDHIPGSLSRLLGFSGADRPTFDVMDLLTPQDDLEQRRRTLAIFEGIRKRALENIEERGLATLYIVAGLASWPAADGGRPTQSPVLLIPIALDKRGREGQALSLHMTGEALINPVLVHALRQFFGIEIDVDELRASSSPDNPASDAEAPSVPPDSTLAKEFVEAVFERLIEAVGKRAGEFSVAPRWVIGNFAFQKIVMVNDINALGDELARHDLVAAIAGVPEARIAVSGNKAEIDPRSFDSIPPGNEFLVVDADSSQQRVVAGVLAGADGVIQGPPGTGKSQTIVNLIASLAAEGKNVLFVAEKRAALEVVLRRLESNGLEHLALDLHGADVSRRSVMARLAQTLAAVRDALPVPDEALHATFEARRHRLNVHDEKLHTPRAPSGLSVFELQGLLLRTPGNVRAATRWRGAALMAIDAPAANEIREQLREAAGFEDLFLRTNPSPWTWSCLGDGAQARVALDLSAKLSANLLPPARRAVESLAAAGFWSEPANVASVHGMVAAAVDVNETMRLYRPEVVVALRERASGALPSNAGPPSALIDALAPADGGPIPRFFARIFSGRYRAAVRLATSLRISPAPPTLMREELVSAEKHFAEWAATDLSGSPRQMPSAETALATLDALAADLAILDGYFPERRPGDLPLTELQGLLTTLAADPATASRIPLRTQVESTLGRLGAAPFVAELRDAGLAGMDRNDWPLAFDYAYFASCLDDIRLGDAEIAGFVGETHTRIETEFISLDRERLKLSRARVRRAWAERAVETMNRFPEQAALVRAEAAKKTRHLPLRRLFANAPDVVSALAPCLMASPLSVSQLFDGSRTYFDVVVFDEASQVLPEDAIPSIVRARHAAVAGDSKQLPPTTFFAANDDDDDSSGDGDEADPTAGFESLLDSFSFLPPWMLEWHYRSRDESLIAFSNRELYDGRLVTFPGPGRDGRPLRHVLVDQPAGGEAQEESSAAEVRRVVELVIEHAEQRPGETLGVIALGIPHARRVEAALDQALALRRDLDAFFAEDQPERFFVKNLERVQGDERDAIILTVGYAKNAAGKLSHNFGPINQAGGERRLNVAITRARRRMTVVSSFTHQDIDPERAKGRGPALLRGYLEYVASGGARFGQSGASDVALNPFEADVADALRSRGLDVVGLWGASGYRIDLVVRHPERPGQFVLAIECDGATYHSAPTARDRDRLRQQQLESLGWRFHRIWSTDWFLRREQEIDRAVAAAKAAAVEVDRAATRPDPQATVHPVTADPPATANPGDARGRASRPRLPHRDSIDEYSPRELNEIVAWIRSDGRLRTDEELLDEAIDLLGFARRGTRIEAALRGAILRTAPA